MTLRTSLIFSLFLASGVLSLQGCVQKNTDVKEIICTDTDITTRCILENAKGVIATIDDNSDWITSAAELAMALDSHGDTGEAWSYFGEAVTRLSSVEDIKKRDSAAADLALALKAMKKNTEALPILNKLEAYAKTAEAESKKVDIICKIVTARAIHDSPKIARELALKLPQDGDLANAYRGRVQREVSAIFAKQGDFESAIAMLGEITADFTYYKAIAHTDIMSQAAKRGKKDIVETLQSAAEEIANEQENTYFAAGIFRDIGHSYLVLGDTERGQAFIVKAREAAAAAPKFQEKARATSRIATRLADAGNYDAALDILNDALEFAEQESSQMMQSYAFYEIAGSAAFTKNSTMSDKLTKQLSEAPFLSATSLRAAGQRDLSWGLVRFGEVEAGVRMANNISAPREKVHALSRIVRLLDNPSMDALPRYL